MRTGFAVTTIDDIARDGAARRRAWSTTTSGRSSTSSSRCTRRACAGSAERVEPHASGPGTGRDRLVAMSFAHMVNLMADLAYHHVVHQAVRGEMSTALKARQRDALVA